MEQYIVFIPLMPLIIGLLIIGGALMGLGILAGWWGGN